MPPVNRLGFEGHGGKLPQHVLIDDLLQWYPNESKQRKAPLNLSCHAVFLAMVNSELPCRLLAIVNSEFPKLVEDGKEGDAFGNNAGIHRLSSSIHATF
jgi:hypothetical protein